MDVRLIVAQAQQALSQTLMTRNTGAAVRQAAADNSPVPSAQPGVVLGFSPTTASAPPGMLRLVAALENRQELHQNQLRVLGAFSQRISELGRQAQNLEQVSATGTSAQVAAAVKDFAQQFNRKVDDYAVHFAKGGTFDGLEVAQRASFALQREIGGVFHGAGALGFDGLAKAGIDVCPKSGHMRVDPTRLERALATNEAGVREGLGSMAAGLQTAARAYTTSGQFLERRMAVLQDALDWLEAHLPAIRRQAGLGGLPS
jgi:flagellar capping protein FliD